MNWSLFAMIIHAVGESVAIVCGIYHLVQGNPLEACAYLLLALYCVACYEQSRRHVIK